MSNFSWCKLYNKFNLPQLHDMSPKHICKSQKLITFTPNQFQLEGARLGNTMKKKFEQTEKMWSTSIKPGLKITSPHISTGVAAKTKNPQMAEITYFFLKSFTGRRVLNLDLHDNGLRLNVM